MTSSYLNMWNFLLSPERVFNEGIIYGRASRVKGTNRELWSTSNKKWQKTSLPQVLKGHKEETALEFWCLIQVHVSEKKRSLQTSSPGERRSCRSLICSKLAVENEMPSSSALLPTNFLSPVSDLQSVPPIGWTQLETRMTRPSGWTCLGSEWGWVGQRMVWVGRRWGGQQIITNTIRISNPLQI